MWLSQKAAYQLQQFFGLILLQQSLVGLDGTETKYTAVWNQCQWFKEIIPGMASLLFRDVYWLQRACNIITVQGFCTLVLQWDHPQHSQTTGSVPQFKDVFIS